MGLREGLQFRGVGGHGPGCRQLSELCWGMSRLPRIGFSFISPARNCDSYLRPRVRGFPEGSAGKESASKAGDLGSTPGLGRSPGGGKGYPLKSSGLENPMDCIVHGVAESDTTERLSVFGAGRVGWFLGVFLQPGAVVAGAF